MEKLLAILLACTLFGCGKKADDPIHMALIVQSEAHEVFVWVNDEPVKVILPGSSGSVPLYWIGEVGENRVWVTTKNESGESSSVRVEIKEGTWAEPDSIVDHFSWGSSDDFDQSPEFTYKQSTRVGADRTSLTPLTIGKDEIRQLVSEQHRTIAKALDTKDLSLVGIDKDEYDKMMLKLVNVEGFYEKVFEIDDYRSRSLLEPSDLGIVVGKRTFLAYPKNGENVFEAGPLDRESEVGGVTYSMIIESISMGHDGSGWVLLY